jgi:hypothetical protein
VALLKLRLSSLSTRDLQGVFQSSTQNALLEFVFAKEIVLKVAKKDD